MSLFGLRSLLNSQHFETTTKKKQLCKIGFVVSSGCLRVCVWISVRHEWYVEMGENCVGKNALHGYNWSKGVHTLHTIHTFRPRWALGAHACDTYPRSFRRSANDKILLHFRNKYRALAQLTCIHQSTARAFLIYEHFQFASSGAAVWIMPSAANAIM